MKFSVVSVLGLALSASAATTHTIQVAQSGLSFSPSTVKAAVGDKVEFVFDGNGHDVSQGVFGNACQPASGSPFYSGSTSSGDTFTITVENTNPIPFYCQSHCQLGMVGVINPKGAKSYKKYLAAAKSASSSTPPSKVQGGVLTT